MYRACIAVVDASRARLFTYEHESEAGELSEQLIEARALVNPARRLRPSELFGDSPSGDDHRSAHIARLDLEFSRLVVDELAALIRANHATRLIVCASPNMLGELRDAGADLRRSELVIDELPRNLVKLTPPQLRDRLADYGLLPARARRVGA